MSRKKLWRWIAVFLILGMAIPVSAAPVAQEEPPEAPVQDIVPEVPDNPMAKLDSELRDLAEAGGTEPVVVYVLAEKGVDLSDVAESTEVREYPGGKLVVATVAPDKLGKLAANPLVIAAEKFNPVEPPAPIDPQEERPEPKGIRKLREEGKIEQKPLAGILEVDNPYALGTELQPMHDAVLERLPTMRYPAGQDAAQSGRAPEDWYGSDAIGAKAAWDKGYTGEGVNIAILDSGVDFGHPDLMDNFATYEDGPYDGWPIALDPRSMREYVYTQDDWNYDGTVDSWDNYDNWGDYTWFAGVKDVLLVTDVTTMTFDFEPDPGYGMWMPSGEWTYSIAKDLVAMSKSGRIRWSVHPDLQLYDFVWGYWIPFIMLDTQEAGVYDTIIADLNFDGWFDMFDDTAVLGSDDPILAQDLGRYLHEDTKVMTGTQFVPNWFTIGDGTPPTWFPMATGYYALQTTEAITLPAGTWVWAWNHYSMDDITMGPPGYTHVIVDGPTNGADGIADISGGMVYYIADGKRTIPGMDYLYPTVATPQNGKLAAFMIGSNNAGGGDHGTLCASAAVAGGNITGYYASTGEWVQYSSSVGASSVITDEMYVSYDAWFETDFEMGQSGFWGYYEWAWGEITGTIPGGPWGAYSGDYAWGVDPDGSVDNTYSTHELYWSGTLPDNVSHMEWYDWLDLGDGGYVRIYINGYEEFYRSWENWYWDFWSLDLTDYAGQNVTIEFEYYSGWWDTIYGTSPAGWYIDDFEIWTVDVNRVFEFVPPSPDWLKAEDEGTVQGAAPGAKIIAVGDNYEVVSGMQGFLDAYTFLAYGVDGEPNSGDEFVDIVSMSYGDGSVHNDGWDWESRLIAYYNQQYLPNTTFFASSGNGGWGYGTINSPQGNTIVSVGASSQYGSSDVFGGGLAKGQINDGDLSSFSGRGPDAYGRPDPDVLANGAWGAGNTPLNLSLAYWGFFPGDGNNAWYEWGGTSRSAPEAAGVMALVYDAYKEANGTFPDFETARQILMSGADDMNHDVLMQGAGRVNADRATDVAAGSTGVYVEPSLLAAGEYKGTHYESFSNLLFPGDEWTQTFTVHNTSDAAASVTVGDEVLLESETITYSVVVTPYTWMEDYLYGDAGTYYYYANYFVVNDPSKIMTQTKDARVRFGHFVEDMWSQLGDDSVDVLIDGEVVDRLYYSGDLNDYHYVKAGSHQIQLRGTYTDTIFIDETLTFGEREDYTLLATDIYSEATAVRFEDDNAAPADDEAKLRFFHAAVDVDPLEVVLEDAAGVTQTLFSNVAFQNASSYATVPSDTYTVTLRTYPTGTVQTTWNYVNFDGGEIYGLFAQGWGWARLRMWHYNPREPRQLHGDSLAIPVSADADFMRVQLVTPFEVFDFCYDDPYPDSICYGVNQRWSLTVFDWTDRNGDDWLWDDGNRDGIVNPQESWMDAVQVIATEDVTMTEINRFSYGYNIAAEQEVTVRNPADRIHDGLVLGIVHRYNNDYRWMGSGEATEAFYQENPLLVKVTFYEKADWGLVAADPTSLDVPAGDSATFDATFTIPEDQAPGLYEGAITVDDGTHTSLIPATVNVAVSSDNLLFTLGGGDVAQTPYQNGAGLGGWTWSSVLEEGDWRNFFYDAASGYEQQYLYVRNTWGEVTEDMPTAFETLVWNPDTSDQYSTMEPEKFGPHGLKYAGGTWDAYGPQNGWYAPRFGDWWTDLDGVDLPETRVCTPLEDGVNEIQFRKILNSGKQFMDPFEATVGVFGVDAPEDGIIINTTEYSGSFTLDAVSPIDMVSAWAGGFGDTMWFRNQEVPQGDEPWVDRPADLMDGWKYTFTVTNTDWIEVNTYEAGGDGDIVLFLLYDANGDGVFTYQYGPELLARSDQDLGGDWAREQVWEWWPQDGQYMVVMYGYGVDAMDRFDLELILGGGDDLSIAGATEANDFLLDTTAGEPFSMTVNWEVPGTGVWEGWMSFYVPREDYPDWSQCTWIDVPVTINAGGVDLSQSTKKVDQESIVYREVGAEEKVLSYQIELKNTGDADAWVQVKDLLPNGVSAVRHYTETERFNGNYVVHWWNNYGEYGFFNDGAYIINRGFMLGPNNAETVYLEYQLKVDAGYMGTIDNIATLTYLDETMELKAITQVTGLSEIYLPLVVRQ
jgi:hypothetical protein